MHPEAEPAPGECCAIIPARGGSKGIIGKNVRVLAGQSLLAYTIAAARAAKRVNKVVVSTDDPAIAAEAQRAGAEVVWRPAELASDAASSESALLHALEVLAAEHAYRPQLLAFLQCTSPLTVADDIDGTIDALLAQDADTALAVAEYPYFLWKRDGDGSASGVNHDKRVRLRRQDRPAHDRNFVETGAVYAMRVAGFLQTKHRFFGKTALYEIPAERVWEIDEPVDLTVAEVLLRQQQLAQRVHALPDKVDALVLDFDGVLTDDHVFVDQDGRESVRCSRSDGMGIEALRRAGIRVLVLSKEKNPVVQARCRKLQIPCLSGIDSKLPALRAWCIQEGAALERCVYLGNDINDIECMQAVGCAAAVADAHPRAAQSARLVLTRDGGEGAVRELCDLILERESERQRT